MAPQGSASVNSYVGVYVLLLCPDKEHPVYEVVFLLSNRVCVCTMS